MTLRYYIAVSLLRLAFVVATAGLALERANRKLHAFALRFGGVEKPRNPEEVQRLMEEYRNAKPDKYSIELTAWKGDDGKPVELLGMTPEQFSALQYTASAKRVTVETLLGAAVRKAVGV